MLNDTSTGEDLTPTQYSVLALVRVRGPLGLAELTELEGLNPTMLSRIVKVLDERGLIRRMPDPGDLRAARVAVTAGGRSGCTTGSASSAPRSSPSACSGLPAGDRGTRCSPPCPTWKRWPRRSSPRHVPPEVSPPAKRYSRKLYRRQILVMVSFSLSSQAHH